jgi:hypothetical protein
MKPSTLTAMALCVAMKGFAQSAPPNQSLLSTDFVSAIQPTSSKGYLYSKEVPSAVYKKLHINITLKSRSGCKFKVVGDITLSWTGGFEGFTGTVTASGNSPCPNDVWVFSIYNTNGGGTGNPIYAYNSVNSFTDLLQNDPELLKELIKAFESQI